MRRGATAKTKGQKMKSEQSIRDYLSQGFKIVDQPPEGYYLSDGNGNYQLLDDDTAERVISTPDVSHICTGCEDLNCDCIGWYYEGD